MRLAGDNIRLALVTTQTPVVAIDGPAASGKGTIARMLASAMHFIHLDTGTLYRSLALFVPHNQPAELLEQHASLVASTLNYELVAELASRRELRSLEISRFAASIAKIPRVREALRIFQQGLIELPPDGCVGVVLDGRDTGTVVCPCAEGKLFVTAEMGVRIRRRWQELCLIQPDVTLEQVRCELEFRDHQDTNRSIAPLIKAKEAALLDTTDKSPEQCLAEAARLLIKLSPCLASHLSDVPRAA